jgi:glutamate 5-kinase
VDEIKLGDNDNLSALVASLVNADLLLILSTVEGLYDSFVKGRRWQCRCAEVTQAETDVDTVISVGHVLGWNGRDGHQGAGGTDWVRQERLCNRDRLREPVPDVIARVLGGRGDRHTLHARGPGRWPAGRGGSDTRPSRRASIVVDDGAQARDRDQPGASLLPGGVLSVSGSFEQGAPVEIRGRDGKAFARGLSLYASSEIERIKGKKSGQIAAVLGDAYADEIVHRDDLVVKEQA